ncbi:uncharacterized protein KNAG_0G03265 [Huiozyma naganishii CBS 8797]|uniref:Uncharacterized protein n=1 Tax=Huiozyma naganishii (strain ATCC MYA-139 / BCRC 22969 / CBS 8797 / KCTC 17520 / NBRC 10181 / NCYC 3082 / Yp74L-3) TaxID=1071383 RepID=J7S871_HUIN7|nr:hypothetical protein KNAG_0G03265 [Kazachstania naganishii CBS 8797]CCK71384.1 hypothetical protein KNAG_0G03265 [Kazachstania naganishii CBS 8797]
MQFAKVFIPAAALLGFVQAQGNTTTHTSHNAAAMPLDGKHVGANAGAAGALVAGALAFLL